MRPPLASSWPTRACRSSRAEPSPALRRLSTAGGAGTGEPPHTRSGRRRLASSASAIRAAREPRMLLDPVASDLPKLGLIVARAGALPWRRLGPADRFAGSIVVGLMTAAVPPGVPALHLRPDALDAELDVGVIPAMRGCSLGTGWARLDSFPDAGDARRPMHDLAAGADLPSRDAA